ncbi:MAG: ABC transporter permease [Polyangiaceae bacterium]|jgi:ABC-type transport system involved in multi-copper enzyme maturation permease subunit|nr:ABC transporter permease [Polyangiaceae bacterium]
MTVTALVGLLACAIGGIMSVTADPATTGITLFHTFFSVAFFVVTLVGPALAANSVASEREGRTWEAVILTGLSPKLIARGKFLSAFTSISLYIVMLAPVGALPFLFGGVTALEVVVAFVFLLLFALLSVAFGLAISSALASGRTAIVLTLLLAFPITLTAYLGLGLGLSFAAHEAWPGVLGGPPVWLPTAYERAPFSLEYVTFLVLIPIASVALPAWFFYEITVANLTSPTEDRATGLKRWFAVMTPLVTGAATIPVATIPTSEPHVGFAIAASIVFVFLTFCIFVFHGDAIGPSRRVLVHWERTRAGWVTRFFGPGVMKTMTLQLVMGASGLLLIGATGVAVAWLSPHVPATDRVGEVERIAWFVEYAATYFVFMVGFAAWVRTKASTPGIARVMLLVAIFVTAAGPWIVAAIAGIISEGGPEALAVAAPSPFFAFVLLKAVSGAIRGPAMAAGAVCSFAWTMIGLGLLVSAGSRSKEIIRRHHAMLAEADAMLAREDEEAIVPADQHGDEQGTAEPSAGAAPGGA